MMWSVKTLHMEENWYHVKVWIIPFSGLFLIFCFCDTGIKSYWCSKTINNKEKNITIKFIISFLFCSFILCDMWRVFLDHITYIQFAVLATWDKQQFQMFSLKFHPTLTNFNENIQQHTNILQNTKGSIFFILWETGVGLCQSPNFN